MRTIKNIAQLKAEQRRLQLEKLELEQQLQEGWSNFKSSLSPVNTARRIISNTVTSDNNNLLKETIAFGISFFAKKMADKAGNGISQWFSKRRDKNKKHPA